MSVDGIGMGHFNDELYQNREEAINAYNCVLDQVQKGNYFWSCMKIVSLN